MRNPFEWPEDPRIANLRADLAAAEARLDAVRGLIAHHCTKPRDGRIPCGQLRAVVDGEGL